MKKHTLIFSAASIVAAAALLLAGCGTGVGDQTGAITFSFGAAARSLGEGEHYRVEVYYGADLYTSVETDVGSEDDIVIEELPTGHAVVYVAQGTGIGEAFVATRSGSFAISIVEGDNSPSGLTLAEVPFRAAASVGPVADVVALDNTIYAAGDVLTSARYASGAFTVTEGPDIPDGVTDVSLSVAQNFSGESFEWQVWVNGTWDVGGPGGIMPWFGSALDTSFVSGFDLSTNWSGTPGPFTVLRSGSFVIEPTGAEPGLAIFFQRNGGLGGVYVEQSNAENQANWPWIIDQIDLTSVLEDIVPEGQEPILDFTVAGRTLYLVTSFTTLRVSEGILDPEAEFDAESLLSSDLVTFATGIPATIVAVAVYDGAEADDVYLGTENGLWKGVAGTEEFFAGTPELVAGTSGYAIRTIVVSTDGEHVAFVSERDGTPDALVVDGTVYHTLDGLPGTSLASLAWLDEDTLLVGGNGGLAALDLEVTAD